MAEGSAKKSNFLTRLISSIILTAIVILLNIFGGLPLILGIGFISVVGLFELFRVFGFQNTALAYICYILAAFNMLLVYVGSITFIVIWFIISLTAILILYVFTFPRYDARDMVGVVFGLVYVVYCQGSFMRKIFSMAYFSECLGSRYSGILLGYAFRKA